MRTVGFIGLGIMGAPMAVNLVRAGYDVVGYNRSRSKVDDFVANGGRGAPTVGEAVHGADVVITMLPDSPDVRAVSADIAAAASEGTLFIDCSTIRPDVAREVDEACAASGIRVLDAPVSGGEKGAIDGTLSIMVGGREADFADAKPVFEAMGKTIVHVGPPGAGQTVKAANQLMVAGNIQLVAEALVFLEAHGVHTGSAIEVLGGGMAGSKVLEAKAGPMTSRQFTPGFRAELHHKDLGIVQSAAREAGVTIPLGAVVSQLMSSLVAQGHGTLDHSALLKLVEQLSGRE
ncbi:MAG: 2-hydroxy-3-oxopropionate reductase [Pseudonocardiaceae bacterium]|nr:2-hydroxy-3-oxopropionate reductase [Pseudonocardiaceae bacterium]